MKIICDDKIPFLKGALEPYARVVYLPGQEISAEVVMGADAMIIRTRTICDRALLEGSSVKIVATATIGYDHIDTAWCESRGIVWKNAPGCNSSSVQQYIASVLCVLAERFNLHFKDLTLGVVGVGHVGSKVAEAARALGMKVLLCDPPRAREEGPEGFVDLNEIVSSTDIITLHVPLSHEGLDATWHMFDSERISSLRPNQILINSSRGSVVDTLALKNALKARRIKAAVLDVWENEPYIDLDLLNLLTIATPHIAGYSADGKANGTAASVQAVAACLGTKVVLRSNINAANGNDFLSNCRAAGVEDKIIYFNSYVPSTLFAQYMNDADFLLALIHSNTPFFAEYQTSKVSGTFLLAAAYNKPMLIDKVFASIRGFNFPSVFYADMDECISKMNKSHSHQRLRAEPNYRNE